jgi:glutamate formiminotransferase
MLPLLAVPNVSEGRDSAALAAISNAFAAHGARMLDLHTDPDHHRSVFSLAGQPGKLAEAVARGAEEAVTRIGLHAHAGEHPRVGAVDVAPIVYPRPDRRGDAVAEALVLADLLGTDLGLPVFLYGDLAGGRTRAELRRGGPEQLAKRVAAGELKPDAGPPHIDAARGAVLVAARPPLIAFNVELARPATLTDARTIAAAIREGGTQGLPGVRAIGLHLQRQDLVQVSTNIEDHTRTTPRRVVEAIAQHAFVQGAELVALTPEGAFDDFPPDVPLRGYDAGNKVIERLLRIPS